LPQCKKRKTKAIRYCFLEFENEAKCVEAMGNLEGKTFKGGGIYVDRVGEFSRHAKKKEYYENIAKMQMGDILPNQLLITGLPAKFGGRKRLRELFPGCKAVEVPKYHPGSNDVTHGTVKFATIGEARTAFDNAKDMKVDGKKVTVVYATKRSHSGTDQVQKYFRILYVSIFL
jgi:hypothetical protein